MEVYLMQHGLAYSEVDDPQRALSPEGVCQVQAAGKGLRKMSQIFDLVVTSPKRRAQQTAALIAEAVRYPYSDILSTDAVLPKADLSALLEILDRENEASRILVVGHLPHLTALAQQLTGGRLLFENAGLVCLVKDEAGASVKFLLTHQQLAG